MKSEVHEELRVKVTNSEEWMPLRVKFTKSEEWGSQRMKSEGHGEWRVKFTKSEEWRSQRMKSEGHEGWRSQRLKSEGHEASTRAISSVSGLSCPDITSRLFRTLAAFCYSVALPVTLCQTAIFRFTAWSHFRNSVGQSPTFEANCSSACQEIFSILWNPKIRYRIYKISSFFSLLSQINLIDAHTLFLEDTV